MQRLINGLEKLANDTTIGDENRRLALDLIVLAAEQAVGVSRLFEGSQQSKFIGFKGFQGRWIAREVDAYQKVANA